jgi:hypothetical protein
MTTSMGGRDPPRNGIGLRHSCTGLASPGWDAELTQQVAERYRVDGLSGAAPGEDPAGGRSVGEPPRSGSSSYRCLAPVLAQALGYHQASTTRIATEAGSPWSRYAPGDHIR